jgi:recombinational DNA repair ATPase RecF
MKRTYISSISIQGFRGINNSTSPLLIPFNEEGITSLFAENGKGKSSIFEALYYCLNGRLPKLDSLHREIKDDKSKKNLFYNGKGKIDITFIEEDGTPVVINFEVDDNGALSLSGSTISNPQAFLQEIQCEHNFLDYNTFIQILLKSPEETGKLFSDLIGFSEFPVIKEKIDKITRTQNLNNDFFKIKKEVLISNNEEAIKELANQTLKLVNELGFTEKAFDKNKITSYLKKTLKNEFKTSTKNLNTIKWDEIIKNRAGSSYNQNVEALNRAELEKNQLHNFKPIIKSLYKDNFSSLSKRLKKCFAKVPSIEGVYLGSLIEKAIQVYEQTKADNNTCLLCKTTSLNKGELSFLDQLKSSIDKYKIFREELHNINQDLTSQIESSKILEIENYLKSKNILPSSNNTFSKIFYSHESLNQSFFLEIDFRKHLREYNQEITIKEKALCIEIKNLHKKVPKDLPLLIEKTLKIKDSVLRIAEIEEKENQIIDAEKYLKALTDWIDFVNEVRNDFEAAFNDLMTAISADINNLTKDFFISIMRNDEISPILVKDAKGQKINILLDKFYSATGKGATPLLSESYRNALCLSIYFASALKNKSRGNFIILDDITSSFDSGHQLYLLDLLKDKISIIHNKKGKQIIFLTHDGLLKKTLNSYANSNSKWNHYSLSGNKDQLTIKPFTVDDFQRILLHKIAIGNDIGSDLRHYYEFVLLDIIEKLDMQIPYGLIINTDKRLVENLLTAINSIIQLHKKKSKIKTLPDRSDFKIHMQQIANNLAHCSSSSSMSLSSGLLTSYVNDIDNIKKRFQYECKCSRKLGWIYYKSIKGDKPDKGCTCAI